MLLVFIVNLSQNIKNKAFYVVIDGFMVDKEFCQKTKILTVKLKNNVMN